MLPTVLVLRHGHTDLADRVAGWQDVPLSARGRVEAKRLGKEVADLDLRVARIVTSDLSRAVEIAQVVRKKSMVSLGGEQRGVTWPEVVLSRDLRPWHLGAYEGMRTVDVQDALAGLVARGSTPAPGGGESFDEYAHRCIRALTGAQATADRTGAVVLVTHPENARLCAAWLAYGVRGLTPAVLTDEANPGEGFALTRDGGWTVEKIGGLTSATVSV